MAPDDRTVVREQLIVPWWMWPVTLAVACGMALEIGLGVPGVTTWLPFAVLLPAATLVLLRLGRIKILVRDQHLHVDDANLPAEFIGEIEILSGTKLRDALSAQLHPLAFVIQRPWVRSALRIHVNDPQDPTPYWIVSTRRPATLRQALQKSKVRHP